MPYTPTNWVSGTTPVDATEMNNLETQYAEASQSFEQDLLTAFVLSGLVATKDGTTATQLDVTAGVAFLKQASDNTLRRRAPVASTQSTVGHASATLFLDLNSDGTWSFATTHSADANHLTICTVTTDASANILTVTDTRPLNTTLLSGALGALVVPSNLTLAAGGGLDWTSPALQIVTPQSGAANYHKLVTWNGSHFVTAFGVGSSSQFQTSAYVDDSGNYVGPVGGGVPTTRNGSAASVPIYTGTNTPSSPPTGAIWIKA